MKSNTEIVDDILSGAFGLQVVKQSLEHGYEARRSMELVEMVKAYEDMRERK